MIILFPPKYRKNIPTKIFNFESHRVLINGRIILLISDKQNKKTNVDSTEPKAKKEFSLKLLSPSRSLNTPSQNTIDKGFDKVRIIPFKKLEPKLILWLDNKSFTGILKFFNSRFNPKAINIKEPILFNKFWFFLVNIFAIPNSAKTI